ncbi:hypothetical protein HNQ90_000295 [Algibacter amylolyticus]|nr:hypothetical protein [Algibacter amylolyticus]
MIRKGTSTDINKILDITRACAVHMVANNIYQWNQRYPNKIAFQKDVDRSELYVFRNG